jgi:plasmid stabilization system protein ParE
MKLRFTTRATENLVEIASYLHERNPAAAHRVRAAIYESLQNLILFPAAGRLQKVARVRNS